MKIANFRADADIVGRRIRVTWDFIPEEMETLADIPPVSVRRKMRDFEFPSPPAIGTDPFLLYESRTFPPPPSPPDVLVVDLPDWEQGNGGSRTQVTATSVAWSVNGSKNPNPVEVLRYTASTVFDTTGTPVLRHIDILDNGAFLAPLLPGITYYYQLFSQSIPSDADPALYRATATATEKYALNVTLYESLPAIYRRHDVITRPVTPGADYIPETANRSGQLRRFLDPFGMALDLMRSTAENLLLLRDIDNVDYRYLPLLAQWIGWNLSFDVNIPLQRNEIKNATRVYRGVGTAPTLRAIVSRYTGWYVQIAEFSQNILRTNQFPQLNIFAMVENASNGWRGSDEAAAVLGFDNGNDTAIGSGSLSAMLTGTQTEPFALRPGMELSCTPDDLLPEVVRFGADDFTDITAARAAEVAAVINRTLAELTAATTPDGRVQLSSDSTGPTSTLHINLSTTSIVTLEGAPQGRLSTCVEVPVVGDAGRIRLFYESITTTDLRNRSIHYKTFSNGVWGNAIPLPVTVNIAQGAPSVVSISPTQLRVAWIDQPYTENARIRTMPGMARPLQPARLSGQLSGPFNVKDVTGIRFSLRGSWATTDTVTLTASDFADPTRATAAEVVAAFNARSTHVVASVQANNTVLLTTIDAGPNAHLEIELKNSFATQLLGFGARNNTAKGSWSDIIDWQPPEDVNVTGTGQHADLHLLRDASGNIWLFWATYIQSNWTMVSSRWNGTSWSAPEIRADELGGNREPYALLDANNRIWLFWAHRQGVGTEEDIWSIRRSMFDPTTNSWSAPADVTPPAATDREPAAVLAQVGGTIRVFFRSNRAGGTNLWSVTLDVNGTPGALTMVTGGQGRPAADFAPAPLIYNGRPWLLFRSDSSISLAQVAAGAPPAQQSFSQRRTALSPWLSTRVPDSGTLHHFAGTTSLVQSDIARKAHSGQWDDMLAYTPQKPQGEALNDDDHYTPGTIGLYISQFTSSTPLTQSNVNRLRQLLQLFLPINVRAVVVLAPVLDSEYLYQAGNDIGEAYLDKYPFSEHYTGLSESVTDTLPNWVQIHSNTPGDTSVKPNDLTTLRFRTYFPPAQYV